MSEAFKEKSFEELYEELCKLPDNVVGEIINGELIVSPRPSPKHANASSMLGVKLGDPFQIGKGGPGGWWILDEPQIHLKEQAVVPDLAGWRKDRLPKLPEKNHFELAPDWVCEVLSPSTARYDKLSKLQIYAENKVPYYWIVDPTNRVLEVFILDSGNYRIGPVFGGDDKVSAPPFEVVEFDLGDLWAE